jgi:hypothetical protein
VLAVAVAHLDGAAKGAGERAAARHSEHGQGAVEQDGLQLRGAEPRGELGGLDDGAVGQLAQVLEADLDEQHGEQGLGSPAAGRAGGRADGHLDEGGGSTLGRGAGDATTLVGEPLLTYEHVELSGERGAADGVKGAMHHDAPVDRCRRPQLTAVGFAGRCWVCTQVVVGSLAPVPDSAGGGGEPQPGARLDQHRLVTGEHLGSLRLVGAAEQIEMIQ